MKRKTLLLVLGIFLCSFTTSQLSAQNGLQWFRFAGSFPTGTVFGGQENGQNLAVCRCSYNGGTHSGKVVSGKCNIGWGGKEIVISTFEILQNTSAQLLWTAVGSNMPSNAVIAGYENSKPIYVGRGNYAGGVHPGKVFWSGSRFICNIGYGGKEITLNQFEVLTSSVNTQNQVQPAQVVQQGTTQGCPTAIGHWKWFTGDFITLKEDGSITQFKGSAVGKWQCVNGASRQVKLIWNNGYTDVVNVSADANGMNGVNNQNQAVSGVKMTKAERDAANMQRDIGNAMNKLFKKN